MPAKSQAQMRFMEAVAHGGIDKPGLSPGKAKEFVAGQDYKSLPKKVGKGMAKGKDPDAKRDAMEKAKGLPDKDSPAMKAREKKLGVGAAAPTPGKVFGANRRGVAPMAGPPMRGKKPPVGFGGDVQPTKKTGNSVGVGGTGYGKPVAKGGGTVGYPAKNMTGSVTGYVSPKKNKSGGARD